MTYVPILGIILEYFNAIFHTNHKVIYLLFIKYYSFSLNEMLILIS